MATAPPTQDRPSTPHNEPPDTSPTSSTDTSETDPGNPPGNDPPPPGHQIQPAGRHVPAILLFVITTVTLLSVDLVSKTLAFKHVAGRPVQLTRDTGPDSMTIPFHEPIVLIPHVLSMRLMTNTGAVFGLGKGAQAIFMTVSILAVVIIGRVFWQSSARAWALHLALAMILAGALGNLYDRIRFNAVRDLLWLFPDTGLWPWIFNIADAALMIGVGIMVVVMWLSDKQRQTDQTAPG